MTGNASVLRGDARQIPLVDDSVDLVVTSPPYFALRSYTDGGEHYAAQIGAEPTPQEYIASLIDCTWEWMRVLKPGGSIWVNLGDKYSRSGGVDRKERGSAVGDPGGRAAPRLAQVSPSGIPEKSLMLLPERYRIACVDELGLIARAVVIWSKPNALPESVTDRVRRSHEDWVHLTKQPRYFSAVDEIREQHAEPGGRSAYGRVRPPAPGGNRGLHVGRGSHADQRDMGQNPLGKLPGSVWEIASEPLKVPAELGIDHFAAFPTEWPRRIILGWSRPGGVVLDPFGGTGTTALVAHALGRHGISVDRSADYCRLAQWRTTDPGQHAKVLGRPKPIVQADGQETLDLFSAIGGAA